MLVGTIGFTIGHRVIGLQVVRLGRRTARARCRRWPAPSCSCLAIPPLIWDRDDRGLHDRVAGTVVIRAT